MLAQKEAAASIDLKKMQHNMKAEMQSKVRMDGWFSGHSWLFVRRNDWLLKLAPTILRLILWYFCACWTSMDELSMEHCCDGCAASACGYKLVCIIFWDWWLSRLWTFGVVCMLFWCHFVAAIMAQSEITAFIYRTVLTKHLPVELLNNRLVFWVCATGCWHPAICWSVWRAFAQSNARASTEKTGSQVFCREIDLSTSRCGWESKEHGI